MANLIYNGFKSDIIKKLIDLQSAGDTIKCCLLTLSYTPSAAHAVYTDLTNEVASGGGYTTGGATLANKAVTAGATTKFSADNVAWAGATFSCAYAALYDVANSDRLICLIDFGGTQTVAGNTFTISWNANGIITIA